jgi:hypothetical protein
MRVRVRTPDPHSENQRLLLEAFTRSNPYLREFWIACGTKWGKSFGSSGAFSLAVPLRPQTLWRWIGPIYSQSFIGYNYLKRMLPREPYTKPVKNEPSIYFPSIDTQIQFFHGQKPESIEGEGTAGNLIDEAAKQKEEVYSAVKTTVTFTRGIIGGISTPKGKNWFYKRCMAAKEEMLRAKHENRLPTMIFLRAPSYENPGVLPETIEEMRKSMSNRLFKQYVEAEFLDDGSVFAYLTDAFGNPLEFWHTEVWYASEHESRVIYVGADWAKTTDYSVFTAMNDRGELVGYKRFNKLSYPEQVGSLWAFCREVKSRSTLVGCQVMVQHDKTGVGQAIDDVIQGTNPDGLDVHGITWTNQLKENYVNSLVLTFEERAITLPPIETLRSELETFELTTSPGGRVVYGAPEGLHDDTVMSLVLANAMYREGLGNLANVVTVDYLNSIVQKLHYGGTIDYD